MADCTNFWYTYYVYIKPLNIGFIAHLTNFLWLSNRGKLSNPENHKSYTWNSTALRLISRNIVTMITKLLVIKFPV